MSVLMESDNESIDSYASDAQMLSDEDNEEITLAGG